MNMMDHDHDHDHSGGDLLSGTSTKSCPMIMVFHAGHCERILWRGWVASTVAEFVFSCLALAFLAFLFEALKFLREYLLRRTARLEAELMAIQMKSSTNNGGGSTTDGCCSNAPLAELRQKSYLERITAVPHLVQTVLNVMQVTLGYLLMLVFMTFNYWLCLSVVLGLSVGYFLFGWLKQDVYDIVRSQTRS